jgi:hypothetical protein
MTYRPDDTRPRSRRPARALTKATAPAGVTAVAMAAALLSGCGGHGKVATPSTTATTAAPTTTTKAKPKPHPSSKYAPLTGLPPANAAQLRAPAVVVKIDNVDAARPQTGVNQADVVYEELVEGGLTRLAAVFQSQYPSIVGPVRSGRLTDEGIADDLNRPVFAYSGTNAVFLPILRSQPLVDADDDNRPNEFWREPWAPIPHNMYTNVAALAKLPGTGGPPKPLFSYHPSNVLFTGAGLGAALAVTVGFQSASIVWSYNPHTHLWSRTQNGTADVDRGGQQLTTTNVVVEFIPYSTSLMASGEGGPPVPIPAGNMVGRGTAWFFSEGRLVRGTWSRSRLTSVTTYRDAKGHTVELTAGRTWVELVPIGSVPSVTP